MARQSLAQAHKDSTRARIRAAALALTTSQGVDRTTMEGIAAEAGVGRATVYFHYANKGAILLDIFRQQLERQIRLHERLLGAGPLDLAGIRAWIAGFIAVLRDHSQELSLFRVATSQDTELQALVVQHREDLLGLLTSRSPGLEAALHSASEPRLRTEALLILLELDSFATSIAAGYPGLDPEIGAEMVAERLWGFLVAAAAR